MSLTSDNLCSQALLGKTPIMQAGERVEHGQLEEFFRPTLLGRSDFDLLKQLTAQPVQYKLLVQRIGSKDENQSDQSAHRLTDVERIEGFVRLALNHERKRNDGRGKR